VDIVRTADHRGPELAHRATRDIPASVVLFGSTEAVTIRTVIGNPLVFGGHRADHDLRRAL
jgi:hypothetical protein